MGTHSAARKVAERIMENVGERIFAELDAESEETHELKAAFTVFGPELTPRRRLLLTLLIAEGVPLLEGVARRTPNRIDDFLVWGTKKLLAMTSSEPTDEAVEAAS